MVAAVHGSLSPPNRAKKAHYSCCIELVDESETKLMCTMLDSCRNHFPKCLCSGDIVSLRGASVELVEGKLVIQASADTTWILFRRQEDFKPSSNVIPGPTERDRLADLKEWQAGEIVLHHAPCPSPHQS